MQAWVAISFGKSSRLAPNLYKLFPEKSLEISLCHEETNRGGLILHYKNPNFNFTNTT